MKKLIAGCAAGAAVLLGLAGSASAVKPAHHACIGESVSTNARNFPVPYGVFISSLAPRNDVGSLGDAVQAVQSGGVPDSAYPNTCN